MNRFTTKEGSQTKLLKCDNCIEESNCYSCVCEEVYNALAKLKYYEDLEEEGKLVILSVQDIHPCRNCDTGWGSISSEGCHGCEETCERLRQYNEKYNAKRKPYGSSKQYDTIRARI